jgi:hypothetical protein
MLTYKFRAYLTHEGIQCDAFPEELKASLERQRNLWNRLAIYLQAVRLACSNESPEQNRKFVENAIFAAIKRFNESLARGVQSDMALSYPKSLKVSSPSFRDMRRYAAYLQHIERENGSAPFGLADAIEVSPLSPQFIAIVLHAETRTAPRCLFFHVASNMPHAP